MSVRAPVRRRIRIRVEGTVQGVGFRPFVYRLATEGGVCGHVLNDERGVLIEAEGTGEMLERLLCRLSVEAPPLAVIDQIATTDLPAIGSDAFEIVGSTRSAQADAVIAADSSTCEDCARELFDPADRRYRYPFVNCTNCGPRVTIVEGVPYDRARTTMAPFRMCAACEREYRDPLDRRFHAQPNACPQCGPQVRLIRADGQEIALGSARDPVEAAGGMLAGGAIVAVKGIGGYHLACDATNARTVSRLRSRKHREEKPFALMVADLAVAGSLVELTPAAAALLASPQRPIVLAPRRAPAVLAAGVAPGAPELGVMLAYTPLHHLLLADMTAMTGAAAVLVMTSGNLSDEPIAFSDDDALERLASIADAFIVHNRMIRTRVDDSIARASAVGVQLLRRSRGYVPAPLSLPVPASRPLLACGAELKSTFCLARGRRAWISHHIGDLEHYQALASYRDGIEHFQRLLEVTPEVVVHDLHPGYASTAYAAEREGVELLAVQHHHAHLAAVLAEHGCGPDAVAVGAIYDGTGYGPDHTAWGGELMVGGLTGFERFAHLYAVRLPGGVAAIREPWRMACAWLDAAGISRPPTGLAIDSRAWANVAMLARDRNLSPLTTSMGRLFDAVAAICGLRTTISYEGQAALELMGIAGRATRGRAYELPVTGTTLDARPLVAAIHRDRMAGVDLAEIALGFHAAVADATAAVCAQANVGTVVLSGGVFQNPLLLELTAERVGRSGLEVLLPRLVPANDGGIAYGQAAVAAALVAC